MTLSWLGAHVPALWLLCACVQEDAKAQREADEAEAAAEAAAEGKTGTA